MVPQNELAPEFKRDSAESAQVAPKHTPIDLNTANLDQLEIYARECEEQREKLSDQILGVLKARVEELKKSKHIDEKLESLQSRVHLVRLLGIKGGPVPEDSRLDQFVAAPMRFLAEKTKDTFAIKHVTKFLKNLKGRSIERVGYMALMAPSALAGLVSPTAAIAMSVLPMQGFAKRKLAELDVKDVIDAERLVNEKIGFVGFNATDMAQFDAFSQEKLAKREPAPTVAALTKQYVETQRSLHPGKPIDITMVAILKPEEGRKAIAERETDDRKTVIAKKWTSYDGIAVTDVKFDEQIVRADSGVITVSEKELETDGSPKKNTRAEALYNAIHAIQMADSIIVAPTGGTLLEWNDGKKIATVRMTGSPDLKLLNSIIMRPKPANISAVAIGPNDKIGMDTMSLQFEGNRGILNVPPNPKLLAALESNLESLPFPLDTAEQSVRWTFDGTKFTLQTKPFPARPSLPQ